MAEMKKVAHVEDRVDCEDGEDVDYSEGQFEEQFHGGLHGHDDYFDHYEFSLHFVGLGDWRGVARGERGLHCKGGLIKGDC